MLFNDVSHAIPLLEIKRNIALLNYNLGVIQGLVDIDDQLPIGSIGGYTESSLGAINNILEILNEKIENILGEQGS